MMQTQDGAGFENALVTGNWDALPRRGGVAKPSVSAAAYMTALNEPG